MKVKIEEGKCIIISAYPGLGKTYATKLLNEKELIVLDSDSSKFSWLYDKHGEVQIDDLGNRMRDPSFPTNYIHYITANIKTADIIFISSHDTVRQELHNSSIEFYTAIPELSSKMQDDLISRMVNRGNTEAFIKDQKNNFTLRVSKMIESTDKHHLITVAPGTCLIDYLSF